MLSAKETEETMTLVIPPGSDPGVWALETSQNYTEWDLNLTMNFSHTTEFEVLTKSKQLNIINSQPSLY